MHPDQVICPLVLVDIVLGIPAESIYLCLLPLCRVTSSKDLRLGIPELVNHPKGRLIIYICTSTFIHQTSTKYCT